jgi:hypothetical protein
LKVEDSTLAVARALERLGVRYYVCGSVASSLHGNPRATNDADFVAALHRGQAEQLQKELGSRFLVNREVFERAVDTGRSFNLIDEIELAKVDVFCVADTGYYGGALQRTVELELEPGDPFTRVAVQAPEDTIIAKLQWYRLGGEVSDRQWGDLIGVLKAQGAKLDHEYLKRWCLHFGVGDLLERLSSMAASTDQ